MMLFTIRTILLISVDTKSGRLQDRHDKSSTGKYEQLKSARVKCGKTGNDFYFWHFGSGMPHLHVKKRLKIESF